MPRSTLSALVAVGPVLLGASGCFDVHMVGAGTLVFDDFEDVDFQPTDPAFDRWACFTFNPTRSAGYACGHAAGSQSDGSYSLFLEATIDDPPDGHPEEGGAGVATVGITPQDLSQFGEMVFDVELESGNPPLPSGANLEVQIGCSSTIAEDGAAHDNLIVAQAAGFENHWQTEALALVNFSSPSYQQHHAAGGPAACLQRVDGLQFTVNAQLPDGQSGRFTLHIDNILFR